MKTRRSHRNQERLWNYLTPPVPDKPEAAPILRTDAEIDAMFWISKTNRNLLKKDAEKQRR